jgi:hypothetical protein
MIKKSYLFSLLILSMNANCIDNNGNNNNFNILNEEEEKKETEFSGYITVGGIILCCVIADSKNT